jgi:Flp pilus assembly protein TadG
MTALVAILAFAIDLGYLMVERAQLQRSADAAAMAAAWELADEGMFKSDAYLSGAISDARNMARRFAAANDVGGINPNVELNTSNNLAGDVVVGYLADWTNPNAVLDTTNPSKFNAVQVRVYRNSTRNGVVPSFFARVLGVNGFTAEGKATAALSKNVTGFRVPLDGGNINILPYALDEDTWNALEAGLCDDNWCWDEDTGQVSHAGDGIQEVNLFPQGIGSPGNRGTVDIGSSNNSTADIARQILEGVSPADLAYHGGEIELDGDGEMELNGDTGISAGVKDELASIIGEPRIIPIFNSCVGPGNNAIYTIVKWCGVRIVDVKLTGNMNQKRLIVQPCPMVTPGAIYGDVEGKSSLVFTPVTLVK